MTRTDLTTKLRTLAVVFAAAAIALTALVGTAGAAGKAPTKVLIEAESGGFFGYVKSPKAQKCANGRTVYVYQQLGSKPRPATDLRVAMDTAQANNDGYQWNIGNPGLREGNFYAHVNATPQCKGANSITLAAQE